MFFIERIFRFFWFATVMSYRAIKVFICSFFVKDKSSFFFKEMDKWANGILRATGTEVIVRGMKNIAPNETYIYIANHTNYIDIPILVKAIPDKIHFMYRASLQKVPMLGIALKTSPFIPLVPENSKNAMAGINRAISSLNDSGSVILFPEGTRSKTGELAPFKRGAFLIASKSNKKIIPVSVVGVEKICPPNKNLQFNKGRVIVTINKPIESLSEERNELSQQINSLHAFINEQINSTRIEFDQN
jgi:1-acyl-sn-glycerol-3-phosphate acyltransferase